MCVLLLTNCFSQRFGTTMDCACRPPGRSTAWIYKRYREMACLCASDSVPRPLEPSVIHHVL